MTFKFHYNAVQWEGSEVVLGFEDFPVPLSLAFTSLGYFDSLFFLLFRNDGTNGNGIRASCGSELLPLPHCSLTAWCCTSVFHTIHSIQSVRGHWTECDGVRGEVRPGQFCAVVPTCREWKIVSCPCSLAVLRTSVVGWFAGLVGFFCL